MGPIFWGGAEVTDPVGTGGVVAGDAEVTTLQMERIHTRLAR